MRQKLYAIALAVCTTTYINVCVAAGPEFDPSRECTAENETTIKSDIILTKDDCNYLNVWTVNRGVIVKSGVWPHSQAARWCC